MTSEYLPNGTPPHYSNLPQLVNQKGRQAGRHHLFSTIHYVLQKVFREMNREELWIKVNRGYFSSLGTIDGTLLLKVDSHDGPNRRSRERAARHVA